MQVKNVIRMPNLNLHLQKSMFGFVHRKSLSRLLMRSSRHPHIWA